MKNITCVELFAFLWMSITLRCVSHFWQWYKGESGISSYAGFCLFWIFVLANFSHFKWFCFFFLNANNINLHSFMCSVTSHNSLPHSLHLSKIMLQMQIKAQYKYVSHLLAFLKDKVVAADRAPETWEEASEWVEKAFEMLPPTVLRP